MERISMKLLQFRVDWLNKALGRPLEPWRKNEAGRNVANIGNFHLDHSYGGLTLNEMTNEHGGVSCPFGHYRLTRAEMYHVLEAALAVADICKKQSEIQERRASHDIR